jgi:hypothetical protein
MKARNIASKDSVEFVRGYEAEVVKTTEALLAKANLR